jgi:hypothetical protein
MKTRRELVLKLTVSILAVCFIGIYAQNGSAKDYELKGYQKRGVGTNGTIKCDPIKNRRIGKNYIRRG